MFKVSFLSLLILMMNSLFALEVDEKLTLRILKTSSSAKTILVNRGQEDGLTEGDHAKFFTTSGVVARAMVVKVSPTRSIWAVYRMVNDEMIKSDQVMSLKITSPVKVTADPSKALGEPLTVSEDPTVLTSSMSDEDRKEIMSIGGTAQTKVQSMPQVTMRPDEMSYESGNLSDDLWEIFGGTQISMMTQSTEIDGSDPTNSSYAGNSFNFGVEKYFYSPSSFINNLSIFGVIQRDSFDTTTVAGERSSTVAFTYGGGINWHFYAPSPHVRNTLIGFLTLGFGVGTSSDEYGTTTNSTTTSGTANFLSAGIGAKYYLPKGFGIRGTLEYYQRGEAYTSETGDSDYTRTISGPRLLLELSYRF